MLKEVEVRYLCQGILTVPAEQLPAGWQEWDAQDKWGWLQEWWDEHVTEDMLKAGLLTDDAPGDPGPGLLEVFDGKEYRTVAQSREYHGWWTCDDATARYEE